MQNDRDDRVKVSPRVTDEGLDAHPEDENEEITEKDRERTAHEEIPRPFRFGPLQVTLLGHDRKGTDVGAPKLGVVGVMIIMRTRPDTARGECVEAVQFHQGGG